MRFFRNVLLVIVISLAILALSEISLRLFFPQDPVITYEDESLGLSDSALGHINRPGSVTTVKTPEFFVEYRISDEGFRDQKNHTKPKAPDTARILLLGDSFTFGDGVQYEEIWPVLFEKKLSEKGFEIEVIKAGVPAYDTTKEVLLLERLFPLYEPDIVVLVFLPNDLFTNTPVSLEKSTAEDKTVRKNDEKSSSFNLLTLYKRLLISHDWVYSKLYKMTARSQYFNSTPTKTFRDQLVITKDLLLRALRYCEKRDAELIVLSIPQQFQVLYKANGYNFENTDVEIIDNELGTFAKEKGIIWISVLDILADFSIKEDTDLYYRLDGHLNSKGNRVVSDYFTKEFIEIFDGRLSNLGR